MHFYAVFSSLVLFSVIIHYLNSRFFKIQTTIAITIGTLVISVIVMLAHHMEWFDVETPIRNVLNQIDFRSLLLNGMLGLFLFGGALSVNGRALLKHKWEIGTLAFFSTLASTFVIGSLVYLLFNIWGPHLEFVYCLLFGAIISPTDPIAVLATTKEIGADLDLTTKIAGESLFNDGIGLVIFVTLFFAAFSHYEPTWQGILSVFLKRAIGGVIYGSVLGILSLWLIRPLHDPKLEILITLCIATFGYIAAQHIGISGPLAMVMAGLIVGNVVREKAFTEHGKQHLDVFWELIDELLNAVLFLLIGLEMITLNLSIQLLLFSIGAIAIALFARFVTVALPMTLFKRYRRYAPYVIMILTWGGLRGGLALAMALSIPAGHLRDMLLVLTYFVAVFSIVVQGLTSKPLVRLSQLRR